MKLRGEDVREGWGENGGKEDKETGLERRRKEQEKEGSEQDLGRNWSPHFSVELMWDSRVGT